MLRKTSKGGVDLYFFRGKTMPTNLLKRNLIDSLTAILLPIKRNNFLILWFFLVKQVCKHNIKEKNSEMVRLKSISRNLFSNKYKII